MNGSNNSASVIADLEASIKRIDSLIVGMKSHANDFFGAVKNGTAQLNGAASGGSSGGGGNNKVSNDASFNNNLPPIYSKGANALAGGNPRFNAAIAGGALVGSAVPSTQSAVEYQLLTQRASFYGIGGGTYAGATGLQNQIGRSGTVINPQDAANALLTAQAGGLAGPNFSQQLQGIANLSNFTPGLGVNQVAQAAVTMQQPRAVNLMMGMGIQIRNPETGAMNPPDQIINQIWNKINSQKLGSGALTANDIRISLEPGNSLDTMLNTLYGNDPVTRQVIMDGLIAKANMGGGALTKATALSSGATTAAALAQSNKQYQSQVTLSNTAPSAAAGFTAGTNIVSGLQAFVNASQGLTSIIAGLAGVKGFVNPIGGGFGGFLAKAVGTFGGMLGLATGGPADGGTPYIVGEQGPELFVPKTDGVVVPNHMLNNPHRASGGPVKSASDFAKMLLQGLGAPLTDQNISNITMWEGKEGGHWKNTARYNPLNTSYQMTGSMNFNGGTGSGVQAYQSWEQGLAATIGTLTGKDAGPRGYTNIINLLKSGNASQADFIKALQASNWDAGHYGGGMSSSMGGSSTGGSSTGGTLASFLNQSGSNTLGNFLGNSGSTINYGGVSINISGSGLDAQTLANEISKVLKDQKTLSKAANS
jgi:hypothetical protein